MNFIRFQSPEGHPDCEFTMKVEVGRLGAPAGGPRPFFDDSFYVLNRFMFAGEAAQVGSEQIGKASRGAKVDQAGELASARS